MIDFVIASTGRSGSRYVSQVLTKAGIPTGHEDWFTTPARKVERDKSIKGDSSCFSVPYLSEFEGIVFHQVRHPLKVLTSLMADEERIKEVEPIYEYRMQFAEPTGDFMRDMMQCIVNMNEEIEKHTNLRYRIEHFDHIALDWMMLGIGNICTYDDWRRNTKALESVSKTTNKHHNKEYLTWGDLPDCKETEMLKEQAKRYGYI